MAARIIACLVVLTLSACASTSQIAPVGKDSYMVVGVTDACLTSCVQPEIRAARAAAAYCASLSKQMLIRSTQSSVFDIGEGRRTAMIFSCLNADDPAYTAATLRKDNGVTTVEAVSH